jgi:hypothetical protein
VDNRKDAGPLIDRKSVVLHFHLSFRKSHPRPNFHLTTSIINRAELDQISMKPSTRALIRIKV